MWEPIEAFVIALFLTIIIMGMTGCQTPDPAALQGYLNYLQREQHHQDRMKATNRLPMRPVIQQQYQINPWDPMQMEANPYAPTMGGW